MSILTVTDAELDNPPALVAVQVNMVPAVSLVRVVAAHPDEDEIPKSGSETDQNTVTGALFQPLELGTRLVEDWIVGGAVSVDGGRIVKPERKPLSHSIPEISV